jgi:hypothetical protein
MSDVMAITKLRISEGQHGARIARSGDAGSTAPGRGSDSAESISEYGTPPPRAGYPVSFTVQFGHKVRLNI